MFTIKTFVYMIFACFERYFEHLTRRQNWVWVESRTIKAFVDLRKKSHLCMYVCMYVCTRIYGL